MCAPNKTKKGKWHSATCFAHTVTHLTITISAIVSGRLGAMTRMKVFLSGMNCMSIDSIIEVFYHLNKVLIATKHIADNNYCLLGRQRIGTSCMQHSPNLSASLFDLWPQQPSCDWWTPLIIRCRESYNSMSMSREPTSLKKSSGDCFKLAKQRYSILSEMMLFLNYYTSSGSGEALVRCGGKL